MDPLSSKYKNTSDSYWREKSPLIFRLKGSVLSKIWPQVALGLVYSGGIVWLHKALIEIPQFPPSFMTVLGLVIGLLLVFRTTTGYDRYWEGRKLWSNLSFRVRMMSYSIWLGVRESPESKVEDIIEKRTAINLLLAFAYATKNYLREEYSHEADEDIEELTPHLDRITNPTPGKVTSISGDKKYGNPQKRRRSLGVERVTMSTRRRSAAIKKSPAVQEKCNSYLHAHDYLTPTDIPLELVCHFLTYLYKVIEEKKINAETGTVLVNAANDLTNTLTNLERILRTPIPLAYSIHLHQCIWLFILFLPFQVVAAIGWFTIPGMGLACMALLGILAIGWEIENPFGYDDNDLPQDDFCDVLRAEIVRLISRPFSRTETWIFSPNNRPFEPDCSLSAEDLRKIEYAEFSNLMNGIGIVESGVSNPRPLSPKQGDGNEADVRFEVGLEGDADENNSLLKLPITKKTRIVEASFSGK